jgi:hypothetical protein
LGRDAIVFWGVFGERRDRFLGSFWGEARSFFGEFLGRGAIAFWGVFGERRDRFLGSFWGEARSLVRMGGRDRWFGMGKRDRFNFPHFLKKYPQSPYNHSTPVQFGYHF